MKISSFKKGTESGVIAVYIALVVAIIVTSGAITLSGILSRQLHFVNDVVANEQAFYLADSGAEAVLYDLKVKINTSDTSPSATSGSIDYAAGTGTFSSRGKLSIDPNFTSSQACVDSEGSIRGETRRIAIGPTDCSSQ